MVSAETCHRPAHLKPIVLMRLSDETGSGIGGVWGWRGRTYIISQAAVGVPRELGGPVIGKDLEMNQRDGRLRFRAGPNQSILRGWFQRRPALARRLGS